MGRIKRAGDEGREPTLPGLEAEMDPPGPPGKSRESRKHLARRLAILSAAIDKIINVGKGNPNYVFIQASYMTLIKIAREAREAEERLQ